MKLFRRKPAPPAPKPKPKAKKPKRPIPADYDAEAKEIVRAVLPFTMTYPDKVFALIQSVRYVVRHRIPGEIVECGVWRGGSMQAAALALIGAGDTGRDLYLFDTFEGMPPPSEHDVRREDMRTAEELLAEAEPDSQIVAAASHEEVESAFFEQVPAYPRERVHFVKGRVEETIPDAAPARISILRLDTDWYESTKHELDHLYARLSPGGVLLLDDYAYWEGARRAVDEFLEETGEPLLLLRMATGRIAVKPGA